MGTYSPLISAQRTMVYTPSPCWVRRSEMSAETAKESLVTHHLVAVIDGT